MQPYIELPVSRWETWGGVAAPLVVVSMIAFSRLELLYSGLLLAATLLISALQLWRYFANRPYALQVLPGGPWVMHLKNGRVAPVQSITPGLVEPWLVSLRCRTRSGKRIDVVVPGSAMSQQEHWRFRRAVLAFRSS